MHVYIKLHTTVNTLICAQRCGTLSQNSSTSLMSQEIPSNYGKTMQREKEMKSGAQSTLLRARPSCQGPPPFLPKDASIITSRLTSPSPETPRQKSMVYATVVDV